MTTQELLNSLDDTRMQSMTAKELRQTLRTLISTANKRYDRLAPKHDKEVYSWAFEAAKQSGGRFTTAGKNRNKLEQELYRVVGFLTAKSSTEKGLKEIETEFRERIGQTWGKSLDVETAREYWKQYNRVIAVHPEIPIGSGSLSSNQLQSLMYEWLAEGEARVDELYDAAQKGLTHSYEQKQEEKIERDISMSNFFTQS